MGEYFDDDEIEEKDDTNEEDDDDMDEEEPKEEDTELDYGSMQQIVNERNRTNHELNLMKKDLQNRVGRIHLHLFGDPRNEEWESTLEILKQEIESPYTKMHPIAEKIKNVIQQIEELNKEQMTLRKYYEKTVIQLGVLLDNSIKMYMKETNIMKEKIGEYERKTSTYSKEAFAVSKDKQPTQSYITKEMVEKFMLLYGNEGLDKYNRWIEKEKYRECGKYRKRFVEKCAAFFTHVHNNPVSFAEQLLDKYALAPWSEVKKFRIKNESDENDTPAPEQNAPQQSSLKENEKKPKAKGLEVVEEDEDN